MHIARRLAAKIAATGLGIAIPALAQPQLVAADPAEGTTVATVSRVTLTFSEPLAAPLSGVEVLMTAMPGMEHHAAMKMNGVAVSVGPDGKSLVATLPRPLPTGSYEAAWHAAAADTRRVTGKVSFTVR